jgi:hypothetical protein
MHGLDLPFLPALPLATGASHGKRGAGGWIVEDVAVADAMDAKVAPI